MKTIRLHHPCHSLIKEPVILALGFFDGVHRGHQKLLKVARELAFKKDLPLAVLTFDCAPATMHEPLDIKQFQYLTTIAEKEKLMKYFGVDRLYIMQYTSAFYQLSPQEFVDQYVVGLGAATVVAGFDYTFGKAQFANMGTLPQFAKGRFHIITVPEVVLGEHKISTRRLKKAITTEPIQVINTSLGYPYFNLGRVIHGKKRGRKLGFPTANLAIASHSVLPKIGVYAVEVKVNHSLYMGMASIGHNPTFESGGQKTVEINILNFSEDIYGEELTVYWHQYLRPEEKFQGPQPLIAQMKEDQKNVQSYFEDQLAIYPHIDA